jgi:hypothetical protein
VDDPFASAQRSVQEPQELRNLRPADLLKSMDFTPRISVGAGGVYPKTGIVGLEYAISR